MMMRTFLALEPVKVLGERSCYAIFVLESGRFVSVGAYERRPQLPDKEVY